MLQVGNTGPTVATNVAVTFDPPLVNIAIHDREKDTRALDALCKSGLGTLAPRRTFRWSLGPIHMHFPNNGANRHPAPGTGASPAQPQECSRTPVRPRAIPMLDRTIPTSSSSSDASILPGPHPRGFVHVEWFACPVGHVAAAVTHGVLISTFRWRLGPLRP